MVDLDTDLPTAPLDSVFHALADPTRRAIVERIAGGERVNAAPLTPALPSHTLRSQEVYMDNPEHSKHAFSARRVFLSIYAGANDNGSGHRNPQGLAIHPIYWWDGTRYDDGQYLLIDADDALVRETHIIAARKPVAGPDMPTTRTQPPYAPLPSSWRTSCGH